MGQGTGDSFVEMFWVTIWVPEFPGSCRKNIKQQIDFKGLWPSFLTFWSSKDESRRLPPFTKIKIHLFKAAYPLITLSSFTLCFFRICYLVGVLSDVFCLCKVSLSVEYGTNEMYYLIPPIWLQRIETVTIGGEVSSSAESCTSFGYLVFPFFADIFDGNICKKIIKCWIKENYTSMAIQIQSKLYPSEGVLGHANGVVLSTNVQPHHLSWTYWMLSCFQHWGLWLILVH